MTSLLSESGAHPEMPKEIVRNENQAEKSFLKLHQTRLGLIHFKGRREFFQLNRK
jgi:hypothetical protein